MIVVVGIGADGMAGLGESARTELRRATVVHGGPRQLALLDDSVTADRRPWPSPLRPALAGLLGASDADVHVLGSGDPMLHGIGTTLTSMFGAERVRVIPTVSSVTLACARLGWPAHDTEVIRVTAAEPVTAVRRGGRAIVLSRDESTPAALARLLTGAGRGDSELSVLENLGGSAERRIDGDHTGQLQSAPAGQLLLKQKQLVRSLAGDAPAQRQQGVVGRVHPVAGEAPAA